MKKKKQKNSATKQQRQKVNPRDIILELLVETKIHPDAQWLHKKLKAKYRNITLAVIKNSLRILKNEGKVWELDFGTGLSRYSCGLHSHYHFFCNTCQKIYDLRIPPMRYLDEKVMQLSGFRILSHRLVFFGICDVCKLQKPSKQAVKSE